MLSTFQCDHYASGRCHRDWSLAGKFMGVRREMADLQASSSPRPTLRSTLRGMKLQIVCRPLTPIMIPLLMMEAILFRILLLYPILYAIRIFRLRTKAYRSYNRAHSSLPIRYDYGSCMKGPVGLGHCFLVICLVNAIIMLSYRLACFYDMISDAFHARM